MTAHKAALRAERDREWIERLGLTSTSMEAALNSIHNMDLDRRAEIERLKAIALGGKLCISQQHEALEAERDALRAEVERLRKQNHESAAKADARAGAAEAELKHLRALMDLAREMREGTIGGQPSNKYWEAAAAPLIERAERAEAQLAEIRRICEGSTPWHYMAGTEFVRRLAAGAEGEGKDVR